MADSIKNKIKSVLRFILPGYRKIENIEKDVHFLKDSFKEQEHSAEQRCAEMISANRFFHEYSLMKQLWQKIPECPSGKLPFLLFSYHHQYANPFHNLGDYIQSAAVKNALESVGEKIDYETMPDRDELGYYQGQPHECIMQGYFTDDGSNAFLPSPAVRPTFVGVHVSQYGKKVVSSVLRQEPQLRKSLEIGCRDLSTMQYFRTHGVYSYFSRCLTLTLPRRKPLQEKGKVFLVNCSDLIAYLPEEMLKDAWVVNQREADFTDVTARHDPSLYLNVAEKLLEHYRNEAGLIITEAIHCAMPALAMGIPVLLFTPTWVEGTHDDRFSAVINLLPIHTISELKEGKIDFNVKAPDIEPLKKLLLENLRLSIAKTRKEQIDEDHLREIRREIAEFSVVPEQYRKKMPKTEFDPFSAELCLKKIITSCVPGEH